MLIFLYYCVLYLSKDANTSSLETAKCDEPTAMPLANNVSTTVPGIQPVVVDPGSSTPTGVYNN